MYFIRKIYPCLLGVIFLIAATGFRYSRYTCLESGKIQFVLDNAYISCSAEAETCCKEEPVCFAIDKKDCCVNKTSYLKTDEDYTAPERTKLPKIEIQHILAFQSAGFSPDLILAKQEIAHSLPDPYSSGDLIFQYGALLI